MEKSKKGKSNVSSHTLKKLEISKSVTRQLSQPIAQPNLAIETEPSPYQDNQIFISIITESNLFVSTYCNTLLKSDFDRNDLMALLDYFIAVKQEKVLFDYVWREELGNLKPSNEPFRGNTPFTRLYSEYTTLYCTPFLINTTVEIVKQYKLGRIDDLTYYFGMLLNRNKKQLNGVLQKMLHDIFYYLKETRGQDDAVKSVSNLLFLRYLYLPLKQHQDLLSDIRPKISKDLTSDSVLSPFKDFLMYAVSTPQCFESEVVDQKITKYATQKLYDSLVKNKEKLSSSYPGNFNDLIKCINI